MLLIRKYKKLIILCAVIFLMIIVYWFSLPKPLFLSYYSTMLNDRNGELLGAAIASDQHWRFPLADSIPYKFKQSIIHYEDEYFFYHPGFNPFSLLRAAYQNLKYGGITSGASTITMQVIRLSRKKERTIIQKIIEIILASRLELTYSKEEILCLYAANAPFGGNTVGLEAASWRYFARPPELLSWGESALLAVLPNKPGLIFPGKNQALLKRKRDHLLAKLWKKNVIDSLTAALAMQEVLPGKPMPLSSIAPHLLVRATKEGMKGQRIETTLDKNLQTQTRAIVEHHSEILKGNKINNAAALVLDTKTGEVLAYIGNTRNVDCFSMSGNDEGEDVDIISSKRSTGSILKPILYAAMLGQGLILPKTLVRDVPTYLSGFNPTNFIDSFDGAVPADKALYRSLNVPAVWNLNSFGVEKFHFVLNKAGLTTITKPPSHYGLSLILGGAEATLWDLASFYSSMGRILLNYHNNSISFHYKKGDIHPAFFLKQKKEQNRSIDAPNRYQKEPVLFSAASIWFTFKALLESYRPDDESSWQMYSSSEKIAWKTGTSYGFRDAWAVGITAKYTVAIWAGNASGEGRPGLTGLNAAAPILFDIFDILPDSEWFTAPKKELVSVKVCKNSGMRAGRFCKDTHYELIPKAGLKSDVCHYCRQIFVDKEHKYRVHRGCEALENIVSDSCFVLSPIQEWYYKKRNPEYKPLPPIRKDCREDQITKNMQMIYPNNNAMIYVPLEIDGSRGKTIFKAAHRNPNMEIYWHIDGLFVGSTREYHQIAISPAPGKHKLTVVDADGEIIEQEFEILKKNR